MQKETICAILDEIIRIISIVANTIKKQAAKRFSYSVVIISFLFLFPHIQRI